MSITPDTIYTLGGPNWEKLSHQARLGLGLLLLIHGDVQNRDGLQWPFRKKIA